MYVTQKLPRVRTISHSQSTTITTTTYTASTNTTHTCNFTQAA